MIDTILFDIGGVVLKTESIIRRPAEVFQQADQQAFWALVNERCPALARGEIPLHQFWRDIAAELQVVVDDDILSDLWVSDYRESVEFDQEVVSIIESLRGRYKLGTVTNVGFDHASVNWELGVYDLFEHVFLSCDIGIAKDDREIFNIALREINSWAINTVFIDDVEKYLSPAVSLGMHGILFKNAPDLREKLEKLGVS